jgi:hypothetical protein
VRPTTKAGIGLALVALVVAVLLFGPAVTSPPVVEESTYGYGVSVDTNATLSNVTLYLPLPVAASGESPVATAVQDGTADAPEYWRYSVIETDHGRMVRIEVDELAAERQSDGRHYSVHQFGATVPADGVVDTSDPYSTEPVIGPTEGRRERPCPNVAGPDPGQTCFDYTSRVYVAYDAPPEADVGLRLVHNGVNSYEAPRRGTDMYYERLSVGLRGPQDGWLDVDGFVSVENP